MTQEWLQAIADPASALDWYVGRAQLQQEVLGPRKLQIHLIFLMLSGGYVGEIEGHPVRLSAGDTLWLPPGIQHRLAGNGPLQKYFIRLGIATESPPGQPWSRRLGEEAVVWCRALMAEQHLQDPFSERRVRALLGLLFSAWLRADASPVGGLDHERRAELLQLVTSQPDRRWRRDMLGKALGISGLHLARQVKRTFGIPLSRWLVEVRIRTAARDLRESTCLVGEIAERYGYPDLFLFSRQFRMVMGVGPRRWRTS
jgi:AraC-like DNA-binding protein